ncbi:MAG: methylmalonyl-CoA mutase family protein, partial [Syntrophales bacterium]|nr:methylmalonyl-CoA mutase family protein [Syntrophales bacterium]
MFSKDLLDVIKEREEGWKKKIEQMGADKLKPPKTWSGFELKPMYTPLDIKDMNFDDIGLPGDYPFTRSNYPLHYQVEPLMMNQGYGLETTEDTRKRREFLAKLGSRLHVGREGDVASYVNTIDLPTQRGLDPDDPAA